MSTPAMVVGVEKCSMLGVYLSLLLQAGSASLGEETGTSAAISHMSACTWVCGENDAFSQQDIFL